MVLFRELKKFHDVPAFKNSRDKSPVLSIAARNGVTKGDGDR